MSFQLLINVHYGSMVSGGKEFSVSAKKVLPLIAENLKDSKLQLEKENADEK